MGLFDLFRGVVRQNTPTMVSFAKEDAGWRALTGNSQRDLSPLQHDRMLQIAEHLDCTSGLANAILNIPHQHIFAESFRIDAGDGSDQAAVDDFLRHPGNQMKRLFPERIRELRLLGEACWPYFVDAKGVLVLGYVSPFALHSVTCDPHNSLFPIGVTLKAEAGAKPKKYRVYQRQEAISVEGQKLARTFNDGECFYFTVNKPLYGLRGRSVLLPVMDSIDLFHHAFVSEANAYSRQRGVLWDVTLRGLNNQEIQERAKTMNVPKESSIRVHNESEEWQALSPDKNASNFTEFSRTQLLYILGAYSIPEHWFANGGDTNRSTAEAMAEPTRKMLTCLQDQVGEILLTIVQEAIAVKGKRSGKKQGMAEVMCVWPPIAHKDNSKIASGFVGTVNGSAMAVDRGFMTDQTAVRMIASAAAAYGIEIDPEEELENAGRELANRKAAESFSFGDG